jgi:hypothetical protein
VSISGPVACSAALCGFAADLTSHCDAVAVLRQVTKEVGVYREGIAAHRARIADKQEQHRLALREAQLEVGPRLRELREACDLVVAQLRDSQENARQQLSTVEKEHAAELSKLDSQVKSEVGRRDEELQQLQGGADEERAKIARLERLIQQYMDKGSASGGGAGLGSNLVDDGMGGGGGARRVSGARSVHSVHTGGINTVTGRSTGGVSSGASVGTATTRATSASSRLSSHQRIKPAVPAQNTNTTSGTASAVRKSVGGASSGGVGSVLSPRGTGGMTSRQSTAAERREVEVRESSATSGRPTSSNGVSRTGSGGSVTPRGADVRVGSGARPSSGRAPALHATYTAATSLRRSLGSSSVEDDSHGRYASNRDKAGASSVGGSSAAQQRPGSALHRTAPAGTVATTRASAARGSYDDTLSGDEEVRADMKYAVSDLADSGSVGSGGTSDTGEEPQPVPAWISRRHNA